MKKLTIIFPFILCVAACTPTTDAQLIVDDAINAHGLGLNSGFEFDFRNKHYSKQNLDKGLLYTRSFSDSKHTYQDSVFNYSTFIRYVDDSLSSTNPGCSEQHARSVHSVFYFFQLPLGLNDEAVVKEFVEQNILHGKSYNKVKITFKEEGGGEDYDDEFLYWFNAQTKELDFMAYAYAANGGGIRFRKAVNKRKVDGILFQDYLNYRPASKEITLTELDDLFEQGELIEVSQILNENIKILK